MEREDDVCRLEVETHDANFEVARFKTRDDRCCPFTQILKLLDINNCCSLVRQTICLACPFVSSQKLAGVKQGHVLGVGTVFYRSLKDINKKSKWAAILFSTAPWGCDKNLLVVRNRAADKVHERLSVKPAFRRTYSHRTAEKVCKTIEPKDATKQAP
mmetsp:Transcript_13965/g.33099  ORF Transcript_13965/g.33099 Transcript_13965/m.33099 type:complete len:158 (+) Transcript_13965:236-709(+)